MDARCIRVAVVVSLLGMFTGGTPVRDVLGAVHRTENFVVQARTKDIARQVAAVAERSRKEIARQWLGKTLPPWSRRCRVTVNVGRMGAGGATSFQFIQGEVVGWRMTVQGSLERVLDSVVPHEVSHTIFASHFRRPLPRWADEGAATLVEHPSEKAKQRRLLERVLSHGRRIPLRRLLAMSEYPRGRDNVLTLYAQGFALADFLVQLEGRPTFLEFLQEAHRNGWKAAIRRHYDFEDVRDLEQNWSGWVLAGSPRLNVPADVQVAENDSAEGTGTSPEVVVRSQSPDRVDAESAEPQSAEPQSTEPAENRGWDRAVNDGWVPVPVTGRAQAARQTEGEELSAGQFGWSRFPGGEGDGVMR